MIWLCLLYFIRGSHKSYDWDEW